MNKASWIAVAKEHFPVRSLDAYALVAPYVGARVAEAANAVAASDTPTGGGVMLNLIRRYGLQAEAKRADLHAGWTEQIAKAGRGKDCRCQQHDGDHTHSYFDCRDSHNR